MRSMVGGSRPGAGGGSNKKTAKKTAKKTPAKKKTSARATKPRRAEFNPNSLSKRSANQYNSLSGGEKRKYIANRTKGMPHYEAYRDSFAAKTAGLMANRGR